MKEAYVLPLMVRHTILLSLTFMCGGCFDFAEPSAIEPSSILGCYVAPDAPTLKVRKSGIQIGQNSELLPFHYQQHKVGMVLAAPMVALVGENGPELIRGDMHFYRVIWVKANPIVRVAFGPNDVVNYERSSDCDSPQPT